MPVGGSSLHAPQENPQRFHTPSDDILGSSGRQRAPPAGRRGSQHWDGGCRGSPASPTMTTPTSAARSPRAPGEGRKGYGRPRALGDSVARGPHRLPCPRVPAHAVEGGVGGHGLQGQGLPDEVLRAREVGRWGPQPTTRLRTHSLLIPTRPQPLCFWGPHVQGGASIFWAQRSAHP